MKTEKTRAKMNRTIFLTEEEQYKYSERLLTIKGKTTLEEIANKTINQDMSELVDFLPNNCIDLLFVDPPYNLSKNFNTNSFEKMSNIEYIKYIDSWLSKIIRLLKHTASVYICGDWRSSSAIYDVMSKYLIIRNRICWEREKGRGAKHNWKNCTEDIWFGTVSNDYYFDIDKVKMKRKVLAPYKINGKPKDWEETNDGNFRITFPSNFWTDITVPYWSMPENTDHPTQKPEKLVAKIILASSKEGDFVFDPFLGSGTTSVVAKKLNRLYCGIELDKIYCCLAEKRLELANENKIIQGYTNGIFWERNSLNIQKNNHSLILKKPIDKKEEIQDLLFV